MSRKVTVMRLRLSGRNLAVGWNIVGNKRGGGWVVYLYLGPLTVMFFVHNRHSLDVQRSRGGGVSG
jgi:hypothetical protein